MANNKIFREKSLERISSPDQLNEYIKVSNSGMWMTLAAIVIFLIGALVWAYCGKIGLYTAAVAEVEDGVTSVYVPCDTIDVSVLTDTVEIKIVSDSYTLKRSNETLVPTEVTHELHDSLDVNVVSSGQIREGDWIYIIKGTSNMNDGVYECQITSEEYAPIHFIID